MFQERESDHICGCAKCTSPIKYYKYKATLKKEAADYSEMLVNTKLSLYKVNYLISVLLISTESTTSVSTQKCWGKKIVEQRKKIPPTSGDHIHRPGLL